MVRFFIIPVRRHWTIRRSRRRFGRFADQHVAIERAMQIAALIDKEHAEVLCPDADGRWVYGSDLTACRLNGGEDPVGEATWVWTCADGAWSGYLASVESRSFAAGAQPMNGSVQDQRTRNGEAS